MEAKAMRIIPEINKRSCGGWIAASGHDAALKIGVVANTEADVRAAFNQAVIEWEAILNSAPSEDYQGRRCQ